MLVQLGISDFAIIQRLNMSLKAGLNIVSGETGAGKSILISAVNLILGGRASADLIRSGCKEARVEALFVFPKNPPLKRVLSDLGIPFQDELLIKRSISREGRNKILINDSMATLQMLSRVGAILISISGQHEHQLLLKPDNHLYILDDFGGLSDDRQALRAVFDQWQALGTEIAFLEREIAQISERQDLTRFQMEEIEKAAITPGEDESLAGEKKRLQHADELLEIVTESYQMLYEHSDSILSSLARCGRRIEKGAEIDPGLGSVREALAEIQVKLEEVSYSLRDFQGMIPREPRRLDEVIERIDTLNRLKRKYGPTLTDILRFKESLASEMYHLDEKAEKRDRLIKRQDVLGRQVLEGAKALSRKRQAVSAQLQAAVEAELRQLHMGETTFQVRFHEDQEPGSENTRDAARIHRDGFDRVEFMICPNVGEELRPLVKIASGGELSRIMLGLKTILARTASIETVVFDEVDAGIGGATAEVVGQKLLSLADYHQILCITHLPQIACQGHTHFLVKKEVVKGRTRASIQELDHEARIHEIARLLGGREITRHALAHAREMLA